MIFFSSYFSYSLYEYHNIYVNRNPENLINIRADFFLENLFEEIYNRHPHRDFIIYIFNFLFLSFILHFIAYIISLIFLKCKIKF